MLHIALTKASTKLYVAPIERWQSHTEAITEVAEEGMFCFKYRIICDCAIASTRIIFYLLERGVKFDEKAAALASKFSHPQLFIKLVKKGMLRHEYYRAISLIFFI